MRTGFMSAAIIALGIIWTAASAQDYSGRPVQIIVPAAPGGLVDTLARLYSSFIRELRSQSVVVENRPGASQMIGAERVAKSTADGDTLLFVTATFATAAAARRNLPFDPVNDLTGVGLIATSPLVVVVHPSLPVRTIGELIAFARNRPGQLFYASSGNGSIIHLGVELLASSAKVKLTHVPYKSGVPSVTNTIIGEVQLTTNSLSTLMPHVRTNRLRALAVTTLKRSVLAPEIPTVDESGVPGYDVKLWYAVLAPGKTPKDIIPRLNEDVQRFVRLDSVKSQLAAVGAEGTPSPPEAFNLFLRNELSKWRSVAMALNIQ